MTQQYSSWHFCFKFQRSQVQFLNWSLAFQTGIFIVILSPFTQKVEQYLQLTMTISVDVFPVHHSLPSIQHQVPHTVENILSSKLRHKPIVVFSLLHLHNDIWIIVVYPPLTLTKVGQYKICCHTASLAPFV